MPKHNKPLSGGNNWNRKPDKIKHNKKPNTNPWSQNYGQEEDNSVYGNTIPAYKYTQPEYISPEDLLSPVNENGQNLANFASRVAVNPWKRKSFTPPQSRLSFSNEKNCNCNKEQENDFLGEYPLPHSRTGLSADNVPAWEITPYNAMNRENDCPEKGKVYYDTAFFDINKYKIIFIRFMTVLKYLKLHQDFIRKVNKQCNYDVYFTFWSSTHEAPDITDKGFIGLGKRGFTLLISTDKNLNTTISYYKLSINKETILGSLKQNKKVIIIAIHESPLDKLNDFMLGKFGHNTNPQHICNLWSAEKINNLFISCLHVFIHEEYAHAIGYLTNTKKEGYDEHESYQGVRGNNTASDQDILDNPTKYGKYPAYKNLQIIANIVRNEAYSAFYRENEENEK